MVKSIFKEIIITLLLCIAILLILSILFYDYNPISKVIPNKIAYSAPESVKNELEEQNLENTLSIENKVYTIEGSDLNIYKKSSSYNPSKQNPFASTPSEDTTTSQSPQTSSGTTSSNPTQSGENKSNGNQTTSNSTETNNNGSTNGGSGTTSSGTKLK